MVCCATRHVDEANEYAGRVWGNAADDEGAEATLDAAFEADDDDDDDDDDDNDDDDSGAPQIKAGLIISVGASCRVDATTSA